MWRILSLFILAAITLSVNLTDKRLIFLDSSLTILTLSRCVFSYVVSPTISRDYLTQPYPPPLQTLAAITHNISWRPSRRWSAVTTVLFGVLSQITAWDGV